MKINEIFRSIQGEGHKQGTPAIFIRTFGCPNGCKFCDTVQKPDAYAELSLNDIMSTIRGLNPEYRIRLVIITGGEPLIYSYEELSTLINELTRCNYTVQLETSGIYPEKLHNLKRAWEDDLFITLSPKDATPVNACGDEYKYVYPFQSETAQKHYEAVQERAPDQGLGRIVIQPLTVEDPAATRLHREMALQLCLDQGWLFSPRLHILMRFK